MSRSQNSPLAPGLYLVATPIGNARDITLRALDILASADALAAEDTRSARRLMEIHGIAIAGRPLVAYHDHNGPRARPQILRWLAEGKAVAYMSEAGTPLIADPGYALVNAARAAGHAVTAAPGPSAVITALSIAGLPTDQFHFAGFAPNAGAARRRFLTALAGETATLVLYESGKRLAGCLADIATVLGPEREVALCRELTKKFEEVRRGTAAALAQALAAAPVKGEIVLLIGRGTQSAGAEEMDRALAEALETMRTREAADHVAQMLNLPRRQVYQAALAMQKDGRREP